MSNPATEKMRRVTGGSFLIEDLAPEDIFTLEDLSDVQRQIERTTIDFAEKQVQPQIAAIEAKDFSVMKGLLRKAGDLGLMAIDVPQEYGGFDMDKVTSALIAEKIAICGSFSVAFSAHVGIGTLPLIWYGTAQQKEKYLARLASGEWVAAYALSEASSGSDAMNIRTRATLSADGKHYVLDGEKMWISNAGIANLFTVFAKIDGEKFAAFLIESGTAGLTVGPEEHKLGIRGSSTCPLILADCHVPKENLLGEAGKGHHIAFNILNVGRYKLGAAAIGGAKYSFRSGVRYARERIAFSKPITSFGLVQQMIADSAAGIFAGESLVYRVIGAIDASLAERDKTAANNTAEIQKHIEEYAVECSILKVWCSEMLERVVDQMLQLHGGYGYVEEYPAERAYRDSRINRIFEGTNEINRLIITGWMMKRAMQGRLALLPAIQRVMDEIMAGPTPREEREGELADQHFLLANAKKLSLFCAGAASQKYGSGLVDEQEIMGALADMIMEVLVLESAILRTEKMQGSSPLAVLMVKYYAARSFRVVETAGERVLGAVAEGDMLRTRMTILRRLTKHEPENTVALGREIATAMTAAGRYTLQI
ncbi:MAG TPA: acyl-CoA dehydrogenase family protein [Acidobacteriaceae bacterium]|nr:acyl-CoA dehydrogenase family protein [Acidobacteriaceae bacterium]